MNEIYQQTDRFTFVYLECFSLFPERVSFAQVKHNQHLSCYRVPMASYVGSAMVTCRPSIPTISKTILRCIIALSAVRQLTCPWECS